MVKTTSCVVELDRTGAVVSSFIEVVDLTVVALLVVGGKLALVVVRIVVLVVGCSVLLTVASVEVGWLDVDATLLVLVGVAVGGVLVCEVVSVSVELVTLVSVDSIGSLVAEVSEDTGGSDVWEIDSAPVLEVSAFVSLRDALELAVV